MNQLFFRRLRLPICGMSAAALILFGGHAQGAGALHTVTQNGDSGPGSLRQAIADSAAGDTITFSVTGSITLSSEPLIISSDLIISGPGARVLNVTGAASPIIRMNAGNVTMSGLKIGPGLSGIFVFAGTLTTINCTISGTTGGAVYVIVGATLSMNGCTISGNTSNGQDGTGLENEGTSTLSNCTISGNTCHHMVNQGVTFGGVGGGLFNRGGILALNSCTVTGNTADDLAGGIAVDGGNTVQLRNTIVANNTAPVGPDCVGDFVSHGYNLIGIKDSSSTGLTNNVNHDIVGTAGTPRDPLLLPLQNNGGGTDTAAIFASASPAFNAGNSATAPARDQRGYLRPDTADIGACEFLGTQPVALANISSRAVVETGENVLIGGFIVTGTQTKSVILRAIGPSLNLPGKLSDPVLELYQDGNLLIANDDWTSAPNSQAISATGVAPTSVLESAILTTLTPGAYTAVVRGFQGATGIGLVEAFDLDRTVNSRLANISTRAAVQTGENVLIGGFIVLGPDSLPVIVRGIGPSLAVAGHMLDPSLELRDGNGTLLAANDNWRSTQEAAINATGVAPTNDAESAIVSTLAPGNYTAILRGVNNTTGVAIVEVYGLL